MRTGKVARITDRVRKELGELTPQERDLAVKALRAALYEGFALDAATSDPNQMEACVRCGSIRIIRKGRGRDGSQRWKCMNCNRTFGVWGRRDRRRPIACPPARQRPVPHPPSRLPAYDAAVHGVLAKSRMTSCIRCTVRTSKHRTRRRVWRAYPPRP